jgi:hypothetical protein
MKRMMCLTGLMAMTAPAMAQVGGGFDLTWSKIAGGGGTSTGGSFSLSGTIGQPDAGGPMTGGTFSLVGGFWAGSAGGGAQPCYANCDGSTVAPVLNVDDFTCFVNRYALAQGLPHAQQVTDYANCDGSTIAPVLNVEDFTCFINRYAIGCP